MARSKGQEEVTTIEKHGMSITPGIYKKYKLMVYDTILKQLVENDMKEESNYWEKYHHNIRISASNLKLSTSKYFVKNFKTEYDTIREMFSLGPFDAKKLYLKVCDEIIDETENMFIGKAMDFIKNYINNAIEPE